MQLKKWNNPPLIWSRFSWTLSKLIKFFAFSRTLFNDNSSPAFSHRLIDQWRKEMSGIQVPYVTFFSRGNPSRKILPRNPCISRGWKLFALRNKFEENLAVRLRKLNPTNKDDLFNSSWMVSAMQLVSETHSDIKSLILDLEPLENCDHKWIDIYLCNSARLLEKWIDLNSNLSRLSQVQLSLHFVSRNWRGKSLNEFLKTRSSVDSWREHTASENLRIDDGISIINELMACLQLPNVNYSVKGDVLMDTMYGVKTAMLFLCNVFVCAFTGSDEKLMNFHVSWAPLWARAFYDLQISVYKEIRNLLSSGRIILLTELEAVDNSVKELYPMIREMKEPESEAFHKASADLRNRVAILSSGLDNSTKEVDGIFSHSVELS